MLNITTQEPYPMEVQKKPPPLFQYEAADRIEIKGKFFYQGDQKFYVRGVTYGAFKADSQGHEYTDTEQIDSDFAMMAANGINTVRIPHTTPPRILLDIAHRHKLKVMVGLSAEQYVGYLIDRKKAPDIFGIIREKVKSVADHPGFLNPQQNFLYYG